MKVLLASAYWPNLQYFYYVLTAEDICIEQFENYQKQSYRNRTEILSANGVLSLSIPVRKQAIKELSKDIEINYKENWQIKHWRAITSAYKNSPYFEYFEDEIKHLYSEQHRFLLQYNLLQLKTLLKILKIDKKIGFTSGYEKHAENCVDLRETIHPKLSLPENFAAFTMLNKPYYQTFGDKFNFVPNLSILDLLFNTGLQTKTYFN